MIDDTAILGSGSWGTGLAVALSEKCSRVTLYGNSDELAADINENRINSAYLPGSKLPGNIVATTDISQVADKKLILVVIPSQAVRCVMEQLKEAGLNSESILVNCSKGIDPDSGKLMHALIEEFFPDNPVAVLAGPSHAEEVANRMPTLASIGAKEESVAQAVQDLFTLPWFRTYTSDDVIGIEMGGVVKNIFAIAAGAAEGLGLGDNAKAALVTRGLAEMTRLGVAVGGKEETFRGLSGIGDLVVTCYSRHSRNNRFGRMMGEGKSIQEALDSMSQVAEGVPNAKNVYELARRYNVRTPLIDQAYAVLYENKPIGLALKELLDRDPRSESD